jgi:SOS response regulatory protein OraA/RecX
MEITKILKRGTIAYVTANNSVFLLSKELIDKNNFKVGTYVSKELINEINKQGGFEVYKIVAFNYLMKMKTVKELRTHLILKGCPNDFIQEIIEYSQRINLLNDSNYIEVYIDKYQNKKNKYKMTNELRYKGININDYPNLLLSLDESKLLKKEFTPYVKKQKIFDEKKITFHFLNKGYNKEDIKLSINEYKESIC